MKSFWLAVLLLPACGPKEGTIELKIYGEEFIEEGIPADEFSDGWAVTFDRFLVSVGELTVSSGHGSAAIDEPGYRVFDLRKPSGGKAHSILMHSVPGGIYDHVGYRLASQAAAQPANATAADRDLMVSKGYQLYAEGTAVKGATTKTFKWGFDGKTRFRSCHVEMMIDGSAGAAQLTIHADHLFYDDLFSKDPNVAFDLIAQADTNGDGEVTQGELAALDISTQAAYQVGSTGIKDLWSFIQYQVGSVGHIDGEGHCEQSTRD